MLRDVDYLYFNIKASDFDCLTRVTLGRTIFDAHTADHGSLSSNIVCIWNGQRSNCMSD